MLIAATLDDDDDEDIFGEFGVGDLDDGPGAQPAVQAGPVVSPEVAEAPTSAEARQAEQGHNLPTVPQEEENDNGVSATFNLVCGQAVHVCVYLCL